ncbi:hypothetical protein NMY22_g4938 [Coprinellus aureogranulatus]|nr:hypothetical protein NMY22_g4938 [Coprinellus aureogranulatus]
MVQPPNDAAAGTKGSLDISHLLYTNSPPNDVEIVFARGEIDVLHTSIQRIVRSLKSSKIASYVASQSLLRSGRSYRKSSERSSGSHLRPSPTRTTRLKRAIYSGLPWSAKRGMTRPKSLSTGQTSRFLFPQDPGSQATRRLSGGSKTSDFSPSMTLETAFAFDQPSRMHVWRQSRDTG